MKPTNDLFQLIKRMSRSEKRSFRLFTQKYRDGEKKYLLLFDAIQEQKSYREEEVKQKVESEIKAENFSSAKNYLWNLINDFLVTHAAETYYQDRCRRHLDRAHLLHKRGIVRAAQKELRTAEKIASKYEMVDFQLRINQLKRNMLKRYQRKKIQGEMESLLRAHKELKLLREMYEEQMEVYDRLGIMMRSNLNHLSPEVQSVIQAPDLRAALASEAIPEGFGARRMYLQSRCFLAHQEGRRKDGLEAYQLLKAFWEAHPHQIKELYVEYRLFVNNFLHSAAGNGRFDLFPEMLDQLAKLPIENEEDEIEAFSVGTFYRHLYALNQKRLSEALKLSASIPAQLETLRGKLSDSTFIGFQANLMFTYFIAGQFKEARKWAKDLQSNPMTQHRIDLQGLSRLFEAIAEYELVDDQKYEHVISRIRAGMEWLRNHHLAHDFERTTLNGLQRLIQRGSSREQNEVLQHLKLDLEAIFATFPLAGIEEVLLWIQSRLLGLDIAIVFAGNITDS